MLQALTGSPSIGYWQIKTTTMFKGNKKAATDLQISMKCMDGFFLLIDMTIKVG